MTGRGIVIEFDFAAMNGADLLFKTTKKFLRDLDKIPFDESLEARCLAGRAYADGLARLFAQAKTKKTAPKAARERGAAYQDFGGASEIADELSGKSAKKFILK